MKLQKSYPYYLANEAVFANEDLPVENKFDGKLATRTALASQKEILQAIDSGKKAETAMQELPAYERKKVLLHCVARFKQRFEELAYSLCIEAGKPINDSRGEVSRLIDTFEIAAEEATRIYGEALPLDISPRAQGYSGFWRRVPVGLCSFISPFNFPLNLAAHKIAPALAIGCPFVLKPASLTPIGALIIGEILAETDLPKGAFSILPCGRAQADLFTSDERFKLLSFTGSPAVGWALKAKAGKKKVVLELGGNAGVIVDKDYQDELEYVAERVVFGAFYQSGQSCISVQRIIIHKSIYKKFKEILTKKVKELKCGNPLKTDTFIGPMISEKEAIRLKNWINEAVDSGADLLCGGKRKKNMLEATLLENVAKKAQISCKEAFGPVAILESFDNFEQALKNINNSNFGLQAGLFCKNIYKIQQAWEKLEVGGVIVGDVPSWRVDNMPYGGVKDSGLGREGIRFAIEDMSEIRLLVLKKP